PDHPDTLISLNNLARAYEQGGLYDSAISMYARLIDGQERVYGADDRRTVISRNSLESLRGS
ncbi:tetratricopeptide repeat protein, partial [Streptosporangium sp. NPDC023963]|uniref:tetratricopeptide repeat protein n=1 Tax=Streptosporangium sp. NPDC023963 TaxID=3155608 RepID=UPI003413A832